jgi:hypothetical protein
MQPGIMEFLQQDMREAVAIERSLEELARLMGRASAA